MDNEKKTKDIQAMASSVSPANSDVPDQVDDSKEFLEAPVGFSIGENESVSLNDGALYYWHTDFAIPGRNGFDVVMTRQYNSTASNTEDLNPEYSSERLYTYRVWCDRMSIRTSGTNKTLRNVVMDYSTQPVSRSEAERLAARDLNSCYNLYEKGSVHSELIYWDVNSNDDDDVGIKKTLRNVEIRTDGEFSITYQNRNAKNALHSGKRPNRHNVETYGLGYGWSFQLPSMEAVAEKDHKDKITYYTFLHTADGRSFRVRYNDFDEYTMKDLTIQKIGGELRHPYYSATRTYHYVVTYKDGEKNYFQEIKDSSNKLESYKLVARSDRFGNTIFYEMMGASGMTIIDSWGRLIKLTKSGSVFTWTLPDSSTIKYTSDGTRLIKIVNQCNEETTYSYETKKAVSKYASDVYGDTNNPEFTYILLTGVTYPSKASTKYIYNSSPVELTSGKYGGFKRYFVPSQRHDVINNINYNVVTYSFTAENSFIKTAIVTRNGVTETITFDTNHLKTAQTTKNGTTTLQESSYQYGTNQQNADYKLVTKETCTRYGSGTSSQKITEYVYTTDKKANISKITETYVSNTALNKITEYTYGANNLLTSKLTKQGNTEFYKQTLTLQSDVVVKSAVTSLKGQQMQTVAYTYDENWNMISETHSTKAGDPTYSISYTYNHKTPSPSTKKSGNITWTYTYDTIGRLISETDGINEILYEYDDLGRNTYTRYADSSYKQTVYDTANNSILSYDEKQNCQKLVYTPLGKVERRIDVTGANTTLKEFQYDTLERLSKEITKLPDGTNNATITYTYDHLDRVTKKTVTGTGVNYEESTVYTDLSQGKYFVETKTITGEINAPSVRTITIKDLLGRVISLQTGSDTTTYTYDLLGNCVEEISPRGHSTKWNYDHAGRVTETVNHYGKSSKSVYNAMGDPLSIVDFRGNTTSFTYDTAGRLISKKADFLDSHRAETQYEYDNAGNVTKQSVLYSQPGSTAVWRTVEHKYDSRNRLTDTIQSDNGQAITARYAYDNVGNRTSVTIGITATQAGSNTSFAYDHRSLPTRVTDALSQSETITYDKIGRIEKKTDRNGNETTYTYDGLDRFLTETVKTPDGMVETKSHSYYCTGAKKSDQNGTLTITYHYDAKGRLVKEAQSDGIVKEYGYDGCDNRTSLVVKNNAVTLIQLGYRYDELNRLIAVTRNNGEIAAYAYDDNGNRKTMKHTLSGTETTYTYNKANLVTSMVMEKGANTLCNYTYSYTLDGNQSSKTEDGIATSYEFDGLGRLKQESAGNDKMVYEYDRFSNRSKLTASGSDTYTVTYSYDNNQRLISDVKARGDLVEENRYAYDRNGNQIARTTSITSPIDYEEHGVIGFGDNLDYSWIDERCKDTAMITRMEYNGLNQLVLAYQKGDHVAYTYRPDGLRHTKNVYDIQGKDETVCFVWDGGEIIAETGAREILYHRGIGLVASEQGSAFQYYHHNSHGDVVLLVDRSGGELKRYRYDAFGVEQNPAEDDGNLFRYCGEYWDEETGTVYLRARNYHPRLGRFLAEDPVRDDLNWYTYCSNSPIRLIDPNGLASSDSQIVDRFFKETFGKFSRELESIIRKKQDDIQKLLKDLFKDTVYNSSESLKSMLDNLSPNAINEMAVVEKNITPGLWGIRHGHYTSTSPKDSFLTINHHQDFNMQRAPFYSIDQKLGIFTTSIASGWDNFSFSLDSSLDNVHSGGVAIGFDASNFTVFLEGSFTTKIDAQSEFTKYGQIHINPLILASAYGMASGMDTTQLWETYRTFVAGFSSQGTPIPVG